MSRRLVLLLIAGLAGFVVFAALFPRVDESAGWNYALGRGVAVERARAVAAEWGVDAQSWPAVVGVLKEGELYRHLRREHPVVEELPAIETLVILRNPAAKESVRVRLDQQGGVLALQLPAKTGTPEAAARDPRAEAEGAMKRAGADLSQYTLKSRERRAGGERFRWERTVAGAPELTMYAEVDVEGGTLRRLERDFTVESGFLPSSKLPLDLIRVLLAIGLTIAALGLLILALVRRSVPRRPLQRLALAIAVLLIVMELGAPSLGEGEFRTGPERDAFVFLGHELVRPELYFSIIGALVLALLWVASVAAGWRASRKAVPQSALEVEELLRWNLSRAHGTALLAGFTGAGIILAIWYSLAASGVFGAVFIETRRSGLISPDPSFLFNNLLSMTSMMLAFSFIVPMVLALPRGGKALPWLSVLVPMALLAGDSQSLAFELVSALVVAVALFLLFRFRGLLAVLSAVLMVNVASKAATLLNQPSTFANRYGLVLLALAGAALAGALLLALRGRVAQQAVEYEEVVAQTERERMQAEFDFAREAQEKMLPSASPSLAGLVLDGMCRPARQVGGDLYDFIPLRNGKYGIVVADVCGKGVPAALYMTIVKGLLLAAADFSDDPLEIACDVNEGLHAVGQRNVFVTMFLGVVDPERRSVRYVRAGHNPAYCYRAATSEVIALAPKGMALGMAPPALFRRSLQVEAFTLADDDALVVFSDGLTEAMNSVQEEYGEERLEAVLRAAGRRSARETRELIVREVEGFVGEAPVHDDLTLVVVRAA